MEVLRNDSFEVALHFALNRNVMKKVVEIE